MEFPTKFNFGHLKYEIVRVPEMRSDDGATLGGEHRQHEGRIFVIINGHTKEYLQLVLMHELIHAIACAQGLKELTEGEVDGMAFGFIQALQQNDWLADFMRETYDHSR